MKGIINLIHFDFNDWVEGTPMHILCFVDGRDIPEGYHAVSEETMIEALDFMLKNNSLKNDTEVTVEYLTESKVPLHATIKFNLQQLDGFRYRSYGDTSVTPEMISAKEAAAYIENAFMNAEDNTYEIIGKVLGYLLSKL